MTDEELIAKVVDHADWMAISGQFHGTVEAYLSFLQYRDDDIRAGCLAEWERRKMKDQE